MEAQLITASKTRESGGNEEMRRARRLAALDRYLKAAGLRDEGPRHDLATQVLAALPTTESESVQQDWRAMIAAVDRALSAEIGINADGDRQAASRGRVAKRLSSPSEDLGPHPHLAAEADWGTPQRCPTKMPAQDLSISRPLEWWLTPSQVWRSQIWRLQAWRPAQGRPAQGLMLGVFCLAVVLVP